MTNETHVCDCGAISSIEDSYSSKYGGLVCSKCRDEETRVEDVEKEIDRLTELASLCSGDKYRREIKLQISELRKQL